MPVNFLELTLNIVIASFGGLVRRLSELEKKKSQKLDFTYCLIGSAISMFVGMVVFFICKQFNATQQLTVAVTAISGYIGAPVLDMLSDVFKKRISGAGAE